MSTSSFVARLWSERDRPGWRLFAASMATLAVAMILALFSAAVAQEGRIGLATASAVGALGLAGWVAVTFVPALAKRTSLRWIAYQVDYKLTREGIAYLGVILIVVLAAVNTGNNLLFLILGCLLAGVLISGVLSRAVLTGVEFKLELPEHIFAEQPILATVEVRNDKEMWPSISLRIVGEGSAKHPAEILARPVYFPYVPRRNCARQKVQLVFPKRGIYKQDAFGIRTKFPFGLFEKTRRVESPLEVVVYPHVEPAEQTYEILPLISGEMASHFSGRGNDLHAIREYLMSDSARFVDWKLSAKTGSLKVREYAREDERRLMLVIDPFVGAARTDLGKLASDEHAARFERAVALTASIAWHFQGMNAVMQFRTDGMATPMAPANEIIYDILRELAFIEPKTSEAGGKFLDELATETEVFKIIITRRAQRSLPSALWSTSYFIFFDSL
ncbi:MAG TPA: DUF58 domain-containing protein [Candidatus Acidoferrales bacterium]